MLAEIRTGPQITFEGAVGPGRADRTGAIVVSDGHARFQEATYRGGVYSLTTPIAGVALAAANASQVAATFQPIVGILNPLGSNVIAVLIQGIYNLQASGASAANEGAAFWQVAAPSASTTIAGTVPLNNKTLVAGGSKMIGSLNAVYTGNTQTWVQFRLFPQNGPRTAAPTASINMLGGAIDPIEGLVEVLPGSAVGLAVLAAGTTITVGASLIWEEIPL